MPQQRRTWREEEYPLFQFALLSPTMYTKFRCQYVVCVTLELTEGPITCNSVQFSMKVDGVGDLPWCGRRNNIAPLLFSDPAS